jgi:glycosyltransferase involved in cell wall biosynthesis
MNDQPIVSIIIPTYNKGEYISKCLQSVMDQTFTKWEAIIVNNYSEDNTVELIKQFNEPRFHLVDYRNHGVIAASRNEGIRRAKGKYVAFLDSDDWWYPKKLEMVMKYFDQADVVYHDLDFYTSNGKKFLTFSRWRKLKKPIFNNLMIRGCALGNLTVVTKKSIIDKVGGLSEDVSLIAVEDFDLWLKISRITNNFHFIPKKLGAAWLGGGNTFETSEKQITRLETVYNKYIEYLPNEEQIQSKYFLSYVKGQQYYKMLMYKKALSEFHISMKSKVFKTRFKSITYIIRLLALKATIFSYF